MPQSKRTVNGGGQYQVNISKGKSRDPQLLEGGHILYKGADGVDQIRLNSQAFPTDNIRKTLKKTNNS